MKKILFGLGMSNSGKGILTKACQLSMGQYCGVFTGENLAFNNVNNDEAQKLRWAMLLRNKRLIISNELSTRKNLDGNLIKRLASGGDTIQGRLHGQVETDFKPQYLAILLANDMPEIKVIFFHFSFFIFNFFVSIIHNNYIIIVAVSHNYDKRQLFVFS